MSAIPIIDISSPSPQVAQDLVDAAALHGFIFIRNPLGAEIIPASDISAAFNLSRILFSAPIEEKQKCAIGTNNRGWSGMHSETLDPKNQRVGDFKEAFNFGPFPGDKAEQELPESIQSLDSEIASFRSKCHDLCRRLLTLFGAGLEVSPPSFFADSHDPKRSSGTILRHLYYPPVPPTSDADIRAGAHSDYGSVTLLFRLKGQPGLEVLTGKKDWVPVPVVPDGVEDDPTPPILVNIGDLLSYWTGGLLRSTVHRVVFPSGGVEDDMKAEDDKGPRYSIAFFCHPAGDTELGAVPSEKVRKFVEAKEKGEVQSGNIVENPYAERKMLTADEHLQMRLRASYLSLYNKEA